MKEYILLIPNNIKKEIIKTVREKYYNYNVKFMSLEEFITYNKILRTSLLNLSSDY